ncbi:hypothetical protein Tco_0465730 [Tanacetum coccineum]
MLAPSGGGLIWRRNGRRYEASEMGSKVTAPIHASMFHDSNSTETVIADIAGPSYSAKQDLSMGSRELNSKTLHQVFVPQWNIREMDYHHLFTEFNVGTARQACLNAEVRMRTEYCLSERNRLKLDCEKQDSLLKAKDDEVESLKAQLLLKETEAAEATRNEKESVNGKVAELQSSVSTKDLELKDLNIAVFSLRSQKDSLVDQVHALETTCSGLREQVSGYGRLKEQIEDRAIEKGMQDGLAAGINHGKAGRSLADIVAYNPAAEADYNSALQKLREVEFPLFAELKSHKDAGTTDAPGMSDLQPDVEQLTLPIHRPGNQVVLGETSLLFALSVTHSRVERIKENVAAQRSALIDVWVPLVDPLSTNSLIGEASTSGSLPAAVVTTTACPPHVDHFCLLQSYVPLKSL